MRHLLICATLCLSLNAGYWSQSTLMASSGKEAISTHLADPSKGLERMFNPYSIKAPSNGNLWKGSKGCDYRGYVWFTEGGYATRAFIRILYAKQQTAGGTLSLAEFVRSYSPASEGNDVATYVAYLAAATGIPPYKKIAFFAKDGRMLQRILIWRICSSLAVYESNIELVGPKYEWYKIGVELYKRDVKNGSLKPR